MRRYGFKTRELVLAVGLVLAGLGMATQAGAECELTFDPVTGMTGYMGHPCAQPHPGPSDQTMSADGMTTIVTTPEGQHAPQDPFEEPPGSNFLMTVFKNLVDFNGEEMPNTLPSTPTVAYNLHDGPVKTRAIDPTNPEDDLDHIIDKLEANAASGHGVDQKLVRYGIDILEGNNLKGRLSRRAYSGFPMLHYNGPNKVKRVVPICDKPNKKGKKGKKKKGRNAGKCRPGDTVTGGNVDVNLIYFNQHIEGDTAFVDPSDVQDVPWTITYHVNILNRGMEDFSPMVMNFNRVGEMRGPFHASMDQSYFPMLDEGTRYTVKIKETLGKYYNLTYIWGWRLHPPRVQVIENALKTAPPGSTKTLVDWEVEVFGEDPRGSEANKLAAINMIGDLSPAKRMWNLFRELETYADGSNRRRTGPYGEDLEPIAANLREAFLDWVDRTKLPTGVEADPDATITLFYVNNTMYGSRQGLTGEGSELGPASFKGVSNGAAHDWNIRPYLYKVTLLNGDHFPHGYMNVDFGGSRGWENQFQYSDPTTAKSLTGPHTEPTVIEGRVFTAEDHMVVANEDKILPINRGGTEEFLEPSPRNTEDPVNGDPQLGSGCFFTFGRNHAWPNAGGPWGGIMVMPVGEDGTPSMHKVEITYNFEPSRRLRIYQFDPLHHDVAVYSLH